MLGWHEVGFKGYKIMMINREKILFRGLLKSYERPVKKKI